MVKKNNRQGFTLTEILVATIIMSMIMTGVIAFVQYGGDIWHRGYNNLSAKNYSRTAFEYIKDELLSASAISSPEIGTSTNILEYTSTRDNKNYRIGLGGTKDLVKIEAPTPGARATNINSVKKPRLARNVKNFCAYRISTWTIQVSLQILEGRNEPEYDDSGAEIEPPTISSESMILLAPGV